MIRTLLTASVTVLLLTTAVHGQGASPTPEALHDASQPGVVFVASEDTAQPWVALFTEGFREVVLQAGEAPAVSFEYLDLLRFEVPETADELRQWLRTKYRSTRVDVVVAIGEECLRFLGADGGNPWPDAAVIYVEAGSLSSGVPVLPGSTGLLLEDAFPEALEVVKRVLPGTRQVVLVAGNAAIEEARFGGFGDKVRRAGLEPLVLSSLGLADVLDKVAGLPPDTAIYVLSPIVDGTGRVLPPRRPCELISKAANVPTFVLGHHDFGCGAVGGLMRDWHMAGRLIGRHTLARLDHALPAVIDVPIRDYTTMAFDSRQLTRWGISETRLPEGSEVRFRPPSLWRDYRALSLTVLSVLALQAVLITVLTLERRRRRRAEDDSRRHLVVMAHLDRRAALGQLTTALAHELHQPLAAILRNAEAASMQLTAGQSTREELLEIIGDIRRDDKRAATIIRRLRSLLEKHELETADVDLHDVVLDTVALATADATARGVRIDTDLTAKRRIVTGDRVHLQQVLLNLLLNALDAVAPMRPERRRLVVQSASDDAWVEIRVIDAGPGLPEELAGQMFEPFVTTKGSDKSTGLGLGLSIVRSIVEAHGGRVQARNNERDGATVWFALPHRETEAA